MIPSLVCPSDPSGVKTTTIDTNNVFFPDGTRQVQQQGLHTNVVVCSGSTVYGNGQNLNGMFYVKSKTKITDATDGSSNTLMLSEIRVVPDNGANDLRGRYNNSWYGNSWFSTLYPPNTTVADVVGYQGVSIVGAPSTTQTSTTAAVLSARSGHTGGANAAMCDGSVRFVRNSITLTTWQFMGTRALGEVLAND